MTEKINMFIPITKVNAQRREVWGWAAIEEPDNSDEILDYESSKPHFLDWSNRAQKRSGGKSLGNVRSMHQNIAAGKLIELRPDDVSKGFYVGAKIIDDGEWKKVESGVYTGFSVGGSYVKRWQDFRNPGKMRYTAKPTELSIVDSPCIPSATFEMLKMDGSKSLRKFQPAYGENTIMVVPASDRFIKVEWDESKHPRDKDGKFGSGGEAGKQETIGSERTPERSPMHEIYGQNEPSEDTRAKMRVQNMGAKAKANFAQFKAEHPDKYEEALAMYGKGGTSTEAIDAVMKPSSGGGSDINRRELPPDPKQSTDESSSRTTDNTISYKEAEALQHKHDTSPEGLTAEEHEKMADFWGGPKQAHNWAASAHEDYHRKEAGRLKAEQRWGLSSKEAPPQDSGWHGSEVRKPERQDEEAWREQDLQDIKNLQAKDKPVPERKIIGASIDREYNHWKARPRFDVEEAYKRYYRVSDTRNVKTGDMITDIIRAKYSKKDLDAWDEYLSARKITKGDVMNKLERIYSILDDVEEELQKADVPESPEPISDIPLKGEHGSYEVEQMPAPNVLMELEANSEPSQEVLASHTVKSEDLTKAFEAWLPKVGKMVKSIVAEALADAVIDLEKSAPARIIKVKKD